MVHRVSSRLVLLRSLLSPCLFSRLLSMGKAGLVISVGCAMASCTLAAILVSRRLKRRAKWNRAVGVVREFEDECSTPIGRLRQVVDAITVEMHAGLASEGGSKLKMLLTFVDTLPTGDDKGIYYALDFGGTNFRVLRVHLAGRSQKVVDHQVEKQSIPAHIMTGTSDALFDYIASTLRCFIEKEDGLGPPPGTRELGFTFSFPMMQTSISSGILVKWTKGFAIHDMDGKDIAQCLQEAMSRAGLDVHVAALVNDTVGTLALGHYYDQDTIAAVIIGTGTNACYVERADAITKCQGLLSNSGFMVVNVEWGNFWSSHLPRTLYDKALDDDSPNPSEQVFEKMISGMYLGDIVRRVVLRIGQESGIFGEIGSSLQEPFSFRTPLLCSMHEDDSFDLREVARIMSSYLRVPDIPLKVRKLILRVCDIVTRRAARLAAAGIVGILKKTGRDGSGGVGGRSKGEGYGKTPRTVISLEGALYESYSLFREYMHAAVEELVGDDVAQRIVLWPSEDGPGIGAALLAAAAAAAAHSSSSSMY